MQLEDKLILADDFLWELESEGADVIQTYGDYDDWDYGFSRDAIREVINRMPSASAKVNIILTDFRVGDYVYALWEAPVKEKYIIYCAEVKEIRQSVRNCRLTTTYILEPIAYRGHRLEFRDDDCGKLIFHTEEYAKEALENMQEETSDEQ